MQFSSGYKGTLPVGLQGRAKVYDRSKLHHASHRRAAETDWCCPSHTPLFRNCEGTYRMGSARHLLALTASSRAPATSSLTPSSPSSVDVEYEYEYIRSEFPSRVLVAPYPRRVSDKGRNHGGLSLNSDSRQSTPKPY
jgi:hypothetical protein